MAEGARPSIETSSERPERLAERNRRDDREQRPEGVGRTPLDCNDRHDVLESDEIGRISSVQR